MKLHPTQDPLIRALFVIIGVVFLFGFAILGISFFENRGETAPNFPSAIVLSPEALQAKSALLYDPTTGRVLFAKNSKEQLPLASLTKLMTAQVVLGAMARETPVEITAEDLKPSGDWGLRPGDTLQLGELLRFALVASSNDAMAAAAASLGQGYLGEMNKTARRLGLSSTYFLNPTGVDISVSEDSAGAYGSARDIALLDEALVREHADFFEMTITKSVSIVDGNRTPTADATAASLADIPGLIGAKTGYTDLAGGNLVAAFDISLGHPLIAVVLGSTEEGRFTDIRALINAARTKDGPL